jgi:hypothetical protein
MICNQLYLAVTSHTYHQPEFDNIMNEYCLALVLIICIDIQNYQHDSLTDVAQN